MAWNPISGTTISKVRPAHEEVMDYLLVHPHSSLAELSALTGYSATWLSLLINTDLFQAAYAQRRKALEAKLADRVIEARVTRTLPEKLEALGNLAVERMEAVLTSGETTHDQAIDAFDKIMHRLGYAPRGAPPPPAVQANNVFFLSREDLASARRTIEGGLSPERAISEAPALEAECSG